MWAHLPAAGGLRPLQEIEKAIKALFLRGLMCQCLRKTSFALGVCFSVGFPYKSYLSVLGVKTHGKSEGYHYYFLFKG